MGFLLHTETAVVCSPGGQPRRTQHFEPRELRVSRFDVPVYHRLPRLHNRIPVQEADLDKCLAYVDRHSAPPFLSIRPLRSLRPGV